MSNEADTTPRPPFKVLFAIDCLVRGGTELQLAGLIDHLDRRQFDPILLTIRPSDPALTPANCRQLAWSVPKLLAPAGLASIASLACWLKREQVEVVHTYFQDSTVVAGAAAQLARVPIRLASFRDLGFWRTRGQELLLRRIYPGMTGFVCNAEIIREQVAAKDAIDRRKLHVIRNGVDVDRLPFVEREDPVRQVGIVGNLTRHVKRTDLFLRAAARVAATHTDIIWHVVGDGHLSPEYEALARELGIADRTVFAGRVGDVGSYLDRLDIGVICSDSEGLSNAIIEYMLKGTATVATAVGGNPELVVHEETGLLVPPDDVDALATAIARLIDDRALRRKVTATARARTERQYSWDRCMADHVALYTGAT